MSDLGSIALRLALLVAATGTFAGIYGGLKRSAEWSEVARRSVLLLFVLLTVAMALVAACAKPRAFGWPAENEAGGAAAD